MSDSSQISTQQRFQDAIVDLWWMSETDAPFDLMIWQETFTNGFVLSDLLRLTDHDPDWPCEEVTLDHFFAPAIQSQDWHGELEQEEVRRFRFLKSLIVESLSDVHVVRIGDVNLDIYIVGKTSDGSWLALSTQAVET